jgi:dihydrofolate reductase
MGVGGGAYPGMKNYVFSRTIKQSPKKKVKNLEIISEDAAEFVRKLKAQEGKDICVMGGGLLAKSLFEANLIDEIGFNIHQVLLGSGIPVFHEMDHQIDLDLLECKVLKNGCVMVTYRVIPPGQKRGKNLTAKHAKNAKSAKSRTKRKVSKWMGRRSTNYTKVHEETSYSLV